MSLSSLHDSLSIPCLLRRTSVLPYHHQLYNRQQTDHLQQECSMYVCINLRSAHGHILEEIKLLRGIWYTMNQNASDYNFNRSVESVLIILNIQLLEHSIRSVQKPILDKVVLESLKLTSQNLKRFAQVQNFMLNLTRVSRI